MRAIWAKGRLLRIAAKPPDIFTSGRRMKRPITERSSSTWNTWSSAVVARPATDIVRNDAIDNAIQNAALGIEGEGAMRAMSQARSFTATASQGIRLGQKRHVAKRSC
ncbi:hypothetical protein MES5069_130005 [Mesorhizobium escarrei]|uniref:Uncharacterized protein n=1 Tax=Mesorhizobium escarrei TaxID=666018 RepID=A0ABM9DHF1_9HYPH|nr:hypothetical protein MES5069_130005 [Mesorhizobium escarrei]